MFPQLERHEHLQIVLYVSMTLFLAWALERKWPGSVVAVVLVLGCFYFLQHDERSRSLLHWLRLQRGEQEELEGSKAGGGEQEASSPWLEGSGEDAEQEKEEPNFGPFAQSPGSDAGGGEGFSWQEAIQAGVVELGTADGVSPGAAGGEAGGQKSKARLDLLLRYMANMERHQDQGMTPQRQKLQRKLLQRHCNAVAAAEAAEAAAEAAANGPADAEAAAGPASEENIEQLLRDLGEVGAAPGPKRKAISGRRQKSNAVARRPQVASPQGASSPKASSPKAARPAGVKLRLEAAAEAEGDAQGPACEEASEEPSPAKRTEAASNSNSTNNHRQTAAQHSSPKASSSDRRPTAAAARPAAQAVMEMPVFGEVRPKAVMEMPIFGEVRPKASEEGAVSIATEEAGAPASDDAEGELAASQAPEPGGFQVVAKRGRRGRGRKGGPEEGTVGSAAAGGPDQEDLLKAEGEMKSTSTGTESSDALVDTVRPEDPVQEEQENTEMVDEEDWEWQCPAGYPLQPICCPVPALCSSCGSLQAQGDPVLWSSYSNWIACNECTSLAAEQPVERLPSARNGEQQQEHEQQHQQQQQSYQQPGVQYREIPDPSTMSAIEIAEWFKAWGAEDALRQCMWQVASSASRGPDS